MAPHIVAFVPAKTVPFANKIGSIGVYCEASRTHMTVASHRGSCEHRRGDQCRRRKFQLSHSSSPFRERLASYGNSELIGLIKGTHYHVASTPREIGVSATATMGDIVAVAGVEGITIGETITSWKIPLRFPSSSSMSPRSRSSSA